MRKLFILISCLYSAVLFGQTNVSGLINSNTTWDLAGSPYIVTGNLAVNAGVTLTIEAGVQVKLDSGKSILMNGELIAIGSAGNEILFTSNAVNPEKGDWGTLICSINATPAVYDADGNYLDGSILQHVIFEYGGGNNTDGQLVIDGSPFMDHVISRFSETAGIFGESNTSYLQVLNSKIYSNNGKGLYIKNGGDKLIENNEIYDNNNTGIHVKNAIIKSNTIENNSGLAIYLWNSIVDGNKINCNNGGINAYTDGIIKNNIITNNNSITDLIFGRIDTLTNNIISDNDVANSVVGIYFGRYFTENQFVNNNCNDIIEYQPGYSLSFPNFNNSFSNNNFINSSILNKNPSSGTQIQLNGNNFQLNRFVFHNQNNSNTTNVNAQSNYWGTTNISEIDDLIYDFFDDFNQGLVDYSAYLTEPNINAPISAPANVTKMDLGANGIKLTWASNIESDHAGYKIYWGYDGCSTFMHSTDLGNVNAYTLSGVTANEMIAISAYDNLADGTDDLFEGHESWVAFADLIPTYTNLIIDIKDAVGRSGEQVCVPVQVYNFENIASLTYSIEYDDTYLTYTGTNNLNLANLSASDIANPAAGQLTFSWVSDDVTNGTTVPNVTSIFEVCFDMNGPHFTTTNLDITDSPTSINATDASGNILTVEEFNAELLIIDQFTMEMPHVTAEAGENICIPIYVYMFDDIESGGFTLNVNSSVIETTGTQNEAVSMFSSVNFPYLNQIYFDLYSGPYNLEDEDILVEVCFDVVGSNGQTSDLIISGGFNDNNGSISPIDFNVGSLTIIDSECANDTTSPVFDQCPSDIQIDLAPGECGSIVDYSVLASDNCELDTYTLLSGTASGSFVSYGTETVIWEASDISGNTAQCTFTITINEYANPTTIMACLDEVIIEINETGSAVISAADILEGGPYGCFDDYFVSISGGGDVVDCSEVGETLLVNIQDDNSSNQCWSSIAIVDNIEPNAICKNSLLVNLEGVPLSATITASQFNYSSSDNCTTESELIFAFSNDTNNTSINLDCDDLGSTNIDIWVFDANGISSICYTELEVTNSSGIGCGEPSTGTMGCEEAPVYCNIWDLDGFVGQTLVTPPSIPCPLSISQDCPNSSCENNQWISFVADTTDVNIEISPFNCEGGTNANALQGIIFEINDCNSLNGFTQVSNCYSDPIEQDFILSASNLTIGNIYTIMLDGFSGALCEYTINILSAGSGSSSTGDCEIIFPSDITVTCQNGQLPDFGEPVLTGDCDEVTTTYTDTWYYVVPDACYKIIRDWEAMENCSGSIVASHTQVIKVIDNEAPIFDVEDFTVEISEDDCDVIVTLPTPDVTDCSDDIIISTSSDLPAAEVGPGTYTATYTVSDGCGNYSYDVVTISVVDAKKPTPYVIDYLVTEIMQTGMTQMINVYDYDIGSYDNCSDVILSFSSNINDTERQFDCTQIGENALEVWVTDEAGNQDFTTVTLEVQDIMDVCGPSSFTVAGDLTTQNDGGIENAEVEIIGGLLIPSTDLNGNYSFDATPGADYTIVPNLDIDADNGVTTYDIFLMTRHILGVEPFTSAYQMIAADANNSQSITTLDAFHIRKVILQLEEHFPNNTSWRFVDADHVFLDPLNPWGYPESISINNIDQNQLDNDFTGIKIGDVNASALPNLQAVAQDRTFGIVEINIKDQQVLEGEVFTVDFSAESALASCQFTLNYESLELVNINEAIASAENFGEHAGALTMSWNDSGVRELKDKLFFSLTFKAKADIKLSEVLTINSRYTKSEAYTAKGLEDISLTFGGEPKTSYKLYQNTPNPFSTQTTIGFDMAKAGYASLEIRNMKGQVIEIIEGHFNKGYNEVLLKDFDAIGLLYYTLRTEDFSASKKMIFIK